MTVREIIMRIKDVEHAITAVDRQFEDGLDKDLVIDLLDEYADRLKDTKVDI